MAESACGAGGIYHGAVQPDPAGVETPKEKKEPAEEDEKPVQKISQIDPFFRHYEDIETRKR